MANSNGGRDAFKVKHVDADYDESKSSPAARQFAHTGESDDTGGGNLSGRVEQPLRLIPATFMGRSGQPDNQDTFRKPGHA